MSLDRLGILHISDIHILLPTPIGTAYQTLTSAVFLANMLGDIDLVINTGDTIDRPGDAMLYTYYR
jgi:predicted MPP superfamily phosphohydrolase